MTTVKRVTDLSGYTNVLPYASELFGVYQPLLGWASERQESRFRRGFGGDRSVLLADLLSRFEGEVVVGLDGSGGVSIDTEIGQPATGQPKLRSSIVYRKATESLPPADRVSDDHLLRVVRRDAVEKSLKEDVPAFYSRLYQAKVAEVEFDNRSRVDVELLQGQLNRESAVAAMLLHLGEAGKTGALRHLFYGRQSGRSTLDQVTNAVEAEDAVAAVLSIETIDPTELEELRRVIVSPIGLIHLFRQYFFELDTFLGPPESHVWLSPGSSVELIEERTERTLVERTMEESFDAVTRTERVSKERLEISDSVKDDNERNLKFGASVTAKYSKIEASSSFDYESSQSTARENAHRTMREQTETLSSEIRRSYRTTYRTVSETTVSTGSKHVLANTTPDLINYELRRKMRQVGVQVQDVGTYLCWQTYVDDPGEELGLGRLLHVAESPELSGLQPPDATPMPGPIIDERRVTIPLVPIGGGADNKGEIYVDGVESDGNTEGWGSGHLEKVKHVFRQEVVCESPGYSLNAVEFDSLGNPISVSLPSPVENVRSSEARFDLKVDSVDFGGRNSVQIGLVLHWHPTPELVDDVERLNAEKRADFRDDEKRAYEAAFIETARERINAASAIVARDTNELREEERIVVYRKLIQDLLLKDVALPDDETHYAVAELINSIFDVDKMLYFVAPEWWRPRLHHSRQQLFPSQTSRQPARKLAKLTVPGLVANEMHGGFGGVAGDTGSEATTDAGMSEDLLQQETTGWGETGNARRDSYYITEESEPARFGASLGWLLQLDGDSRRNAFLNAPWVKAALPIRPGKEKAAINWLRAVEGAGGIDTAVYQTSNPQEVDLNGDPLDGQTMTAVLEDLAERVARKHRDALKPSVYPTSAEVSPDVLDTGNTVTSTPVDRVYEHGFYPLENSFRVDVDDHFEIFDQWIEVLPTDQTVPVEVKYDPKTGRQL